MSTVDLDQTGSPAPETETERQVRIAEETEMIAQARLSVSAGRLVESAAVKAWIDSIDTEDELPPPFSRT
jgi:hypothetical protein